jgi:DNA-binding transcriptional LysR family regulator
MPNLAHLDLNLLVLFEALMAERNVTRAAVRVGVAQPSASKALDRLRHLFGDELFVRTPGGMRPTPRASELEPEIAALLDRVRRLVAARVPFDAASARGVVRVAMSDAAEFVLLPGLVGRLGEAAPGIDLRVRPLDKGRAPDDLDAGQVDALIGVFPGLPKRYRTADLWEERFLCLARADHPRLGRELSLDVFAELPHLLVTLRDDAHGAVDEALARLGRSRRIVATVGRFLIVPHVLRCSDALAMLPSRLATAVAAGTGCRAFEPPLGLRGWTETLVWSRATERLPLQVWFRGLVRYLATRA